MSFLEDIKRMQEMNENLQKEGDGKKQVCYPTAYQGTHIIRIFRGTKSTLPVREIQRIEVPGEGDSGNKIMDPAVAGYKSETMGLVYQLKDAKIADLTKLFKYNKRGIFWGQVVGSSNQEFLKNYPEGSFQLIMVSRSLYKSLIASFASLNEEDYKALTTAAKGPTLQIIRGENPMNSTIGFSFSQYQTFGTQQEMDSYLDNLDSLDSIYYNNPPTSEEIEKAIIKDREMAEEIKRKYMKTPDSQTNPPQDTSPNSSQPEPQKPAGVDEMQGFGGFGNFAKPQEWKG